MALTGLQIQRILPKTNCKECGYNTCLAFAMKLAVKKADLADCPDVSDEAKSILGAASEPPIKCVELGAEKSLKLGEETVLFRHEKTFVHQTLLAVNINDTDPSEDIENVLNSIKNYMLERVGETFQIDMIAVTQKKENPQDFISLAEKAWKIAHRPLIIRSQNTKALTVVARKVKGSHSVLVSATAENIEELRKASEENEHILAVTAPNLNSLVTLTEELRNNGFHNFLLQFQTHSLAEQFQVNSITRRAALKGNYKPLGYPILRFLESDDLYINAVSAITEISKYGGICVLPSFDAAQLVSLMTLRLNIYTDPQKPIQVEPQIFSIGDPKPDSPVFVTTNFSLTYFIVSGEIENSGISAWLLVPECEGMSVLTAWAAGKFSGSTIAKFAKEIKPDELVTTREIIIPGYVARISGELEEFLPGWKVLVGPQEAADLESFIKARLN
jgi:acetyl-CoA decarbonylase/synthase complex subunit gamma